MKQVKLHEKLMRPHGLTLIEIMVVIVILGILAAMVGTNALGILFGSKIDVSKTQIANFKQSLEAFAVKTGTYPDTGEGLQVMVNPGSGLQPFMESIPDDPWNNPYQYRSPGNDGRAFDIWSYGPDGQEGTEDDIQSWTMQLGQVQRK